jgi:hypothetical protein
MNRLLGLVQVVGYRSFVPWRKPNSLMREMNNVFVRWKEAGWTVTEWMGADFGSSQACHGPGNSEKYGKACIQFCIIPF